MNHRYVAMLLLIAGLGLSGCNSCHNDGGGARWDVGDRSDITGSDTAEDVVDDADTSAADADDADTTDMTDATDIQDAPSDIDDARSDTGDSADATDIADPGERLSCLAADDAHCPIQDPGSFGDCAMPLGVVFDGSSCVPASGCDCTGADCPAFDSIEECASQCGDAGACRADDMPLVWGTETLTCGDQNCGDRMTFCVSSDTDPTGRLSQVMPDIGVDCVRSDGGCHLRDPLDEADKCVDGDWCCTEHQATGYTDTELRQLCGITLMPGVKQATCFYFE